MQQSKSHRERKSPTKRHGREIPISVVVGADNQWRFDEVLSNGKKMADFFSSSTPPDSGPDDGCDEEFDIELEPSNSGIRINRQPLDEFEDIGEDEIEHDEPVAQSTPIEVEITEDEALSQLAALHIAHLILKDRGSGGRMNGTITHHHWSRKLEPRREGRIRLPRQIIAVA